MTVGAIIKNFRFTPKVDMRGALAYVRFGSKADICTATAMSALPPKADMCSAQADVRFVPIADIHGNLWPRHHPGRLFQQGKVGGLAVHIGVGGREHAERVVLEQPGMQIIVHVLFWN